MPSVNAARQEIGVAKVTGSSTPGQITVGTSPTTILAGNDARKGFSVQNTGTTIIKLAFGKTPNQTEYHIALRNGSAADDGTGGVWIDDIFDGDVNAISSGAGGTVVVTELF